MENPTHSINRFASDITASRDRAAIGSGLSAVVALGGYYGHFHSKELLAVGLAGWLGSTLSYISLGRQLQKLEPHL